MPWGLIGAAIIATGGILSAIVAFILERRRRANSLRSALRSELESMGMYTALLREEVISSTNEKSMYALDFPSTTVYESNAGDLGLLSDTESHLLVRYYSMLQEVEAMVRMGYEQDEEISLKKKGEHLEVIRLFCILLLGSPKLGRKFDGGEYMSDVLETDSEEILSTVDEIFSDSEWAYEETKEDMRRLAEKYGKD